MWAYIKIQIQTTSLGFFQDFIGVPDDLWGLVRPIQVLGQEMGQCCLWSGELWSKSGIFINLEDVLQASYRCLTFGSRSERRIQSTEFAFYNSALLRPSTTNITMWKEKAIQPWWLGGRAVVYKQSYRISLSRWINPSLGRAWLYGTNGLALLCTVVYDKLLLLLRKLEIILFSCSQVYGENTILGFSTVIQIKNNLKNKFLKQK